MTFLPERIGRGAPPVTRIEGGASVAYSFGAVLVALLALEAITGIALAMFYSPSTTNAWASVAYIQDRAAGGWLVRGLHHHGASAMVIVAGLHLVQTAVAGAYKRPRELVWWLGVLSLVLLLAWAVTGYVLRWDQAGYWANRVEIGVIASMPVVGETLAEALLGGNDYGNLTLTRFYTLHALVLPAVVIAIVVAHVVISRRLGPTPVKHGPALPRWPHQSLRDVVVTALVLAALLSFVISQEGIELAAPADPTAPYDARPLWYFRWLFELRELAGSAETLVALLVPAVLVGFLLVLPLLDRAPDRTVRQRLPWLGALAGLFALVGALSVVSIARDLGDEDLAARRRHADARGHRARSIAKAVGVPVTGGRDVWTMQPMYRARTLFAEQCESCHAADSADRLGPVIGPGHKDRAWLKAFLADPSGPEFYGRTKLVADSKKAQANEEAAADAGLADLAMKAVALPGGELDDLVELLYSLSGATDFDAAKRERGVAVFESACTDCHELAEGVSSEGGPNLAGLGSRAYFRSFIGNPKSGIHMGPNKSEMPRFDRDLSVTDLDALAEYLVWLRTAKKTDVDALGPLE